MMNGEWLCSKEERGLFSETPLGIPILMPPIMPPEEVFRKPLPESTIPIHIPPIEMIRNNPDLFPSVLCYHQISEKVTCQINPLPSTAKPYTGSQLSQKQITSIQIPDPSLIKVRLPVNKMRM